MLQIDYSTVDKLFQLPTPDFNALIPGRRTICHIYWYSYCIVCLECTWGKKSIFGTI